MDASYGLIINGKESGEYEVANSKTTGFFIPYDVRALELISIGRDKRLGVLVASNDDTLRFFMKIDKINQD